jgi:hypothetical protein
MNASHSPADQICGGCSDLAFASVALQSFLLMRLSVVRPIETRKFIAVSRQYLHNEEEAIGKTHRFCCFCC